MNRRDAVRKMAAFGVIPSLSAQTLHGREPISEVNDKRTPWLGCWQLLTEEKEDVLVHKDTSVAMRPRSGFVVYVGNYFIEIRTSGRRDLPTSPKLTEQERSQYFDSFHAAFGACTWESSNGKWTGSHTVSIAMDPRLEGSTFECHFDFKDDSCEREINGPDETKTTETWRRLSGKGETPLSGAWESKSEAGHWVYLTTQGHYGVMRSAPRPQTGSRERAYTDKEKIKLYPLAGANIGARIETSETFDHWPFVSQVPGYEIRKHETFKIISIGKNRFEASIPPDIPPGEWQRLP